MLTEHWSSDPRPMIVPRTASVLSSWSRTVIDALLAHGIDPQDLLAETGFSPDSFRDPNARHSIEAIGALWHRAAERVGDPAFGLTVPRYVRQTTFHALGYSLLASMTLGDALERASHFSRVVVDAGSLELEVEGPQARLRMLPRPGHEPCAAELKDGVWSMIVRVVRRLTRGAFVLDHVQLRRSATVDLAPYRRFFACPVSFGGSDVLTFSAAMLSLPLETGNAELASFSDAAAQDYLTRMATGTYVLRVRAAIGDLLPTQLSPHAVAKRLGMSLRTMQRTLGEQGTSYEAVLSELRRDRACRMLSLPRHSVGEIASALGYRTLSAFARAFKRWTGMSPSEYAAEQARTRSLSAPPQAPLSHSRS